MAKKGYSLGSLADYADTKVSKSGDTITGSLIFSIAGVAVETKGGTIRSNASNIMSMDGKTYSFVTSPQDTHLCQNAYWDGAWKKYDDDIVSGVLAIIDGDLLLHKSDATSEEVRQFSYKIYHEGFKPTATDVKAVSKSGDTMTGDLEVPRVLVGGKLATEVDGETVGLKNEITQKSLHLSSDGKLRYDGLDVLQVLGDNSLGTAAGPIPRTVLAGTGTPMYELHVPSKFAGALALHGENGNLEFWQTNGVGNWVNTYGFWHQATGELYGGGNANFNDVFIRSDERLKTDRKPLSGALEKVCSLQGYTYTKHKSLSDDTVLGREAGILAQDLEKVLPEATRAAEDTQMTISNSGVNALLVEAVKELTLKIQDLERRCYGLGVR